MFATAKKKRVAYYSPDVTTPREERHAAKTDVTRLEEDCGRYSSANDETMISVGPDRTLLE